MKSKLNTQQENNFRTVSKLSFIPFGILLVLMSTSAFANNVTSEINVAAETSTALQKPIIVEAEDSISINPSYKKAIEDVIKEDNIIIESTISNEVFPLDFKKIYNAPATRKKEKGKSASHT